MVTTTICCVLRATRTNCPGPLAALPVTAPTPASTPPAPAAGPGTAPLYPLAAPLPAAVVPAVVPAVISSTVPVAAGNIVAPSNKRTNDTSAADALNAYSTVIQHTVVNGAGLYKALHMADITRGEWRFLRLLAEAQMVNGQRTQQILLTTNSIKAVLALIKLVLATERALKPI